MTTVKLFEVRDKATTMACIGIDCDTRDTDIKDYKLLRHSGFSPSTCILFGRLRGGTFNYDVYSWGDRTMHVAHHYIEANWPSLKSGDIVDVEYILGETAQPKETDL